MTILTRLQKALAACPENWTMSKCKCGDKVCSSWFLNFTRCDGRLDKREADLVVLMKENLPALLEGLRIMSEMADHLDWIGWGDPYERDGSKELREDLGKFRENLR